jgi:hypothetical protein
MRLKEIFHRHKAAPPMFSTLSTACGKNKENLKKFLYFFRMTSHLPINTLGSTD